MDLNAVEGVVRPGCRAELPARQDGDAFLAGGTWVFSEPQPHLRRLIDLAALGWPAIETHVNGISIAATCTLAELEAMAANAAFPAAALIQQCCRALWGSFKIWNMATVGGNLCLALPAAPLAALAVALDGVCTVWRADGTDDSVPARDFILGPGKTCLAPGDVLRRVAIGREALEGRFAFRQVSLTEEGRSAALVIGRSVGGGVKLTITAATRRPVQCGFTTPPDTERVVRDIDRTVDAAGGWFDDCHGAPDWRRHMTHRLAGEICRELAAR